MRYFDVLFLLVALCSTTQGNKMHDSFQSCNQVDPTEILECRKSATEQSWKLLRNGIPELQIQPMEPLTVPSVTIGEGKNAVNMVQNYKNLRIYGLPDSKIDKMNLTLTDKDFKFEFKVHAPEYRFEADYDINGRVLLLPVVGKGPCNVTGINPKIDFSASGKVTKKQDKPHLHADKCVVVIRPETVAFKFDNLFDGDEVLGKQINSVLNENWKEVFEDVREGYEKVLASIICAYANTLFAKLSLEQLFPK